MAEATASTVTLRARAKGRRRWLKLSTLALVVAWPFVAWGAAAWLAAGACVARVEASSADAIVVLAGSSTYVERARSAAALYKEGRAPRIVLTDDGLRGGWSEAEQRNPRFVERAADELRRAGVPAESIEMVGREVSSTYEEAAALREYAQARGLRSFVVVTSAYHSRRAMWTLRRVFDGSGVRLTLEAVAPGEQSPSPATWWLSVLGWKMVAGEYAKLVYYRLRY